MPLTADVADRKQRARAVIRSRRRRLIMPDDTGETHRNDVLLTLPEVADLRPGDTVACYASRANEPATGRLRAVLAERHLRVLLPVLLEDLDLGWALDSGRLSAGAGPGVPEPVGPRLGVDAIADARVVIVPALGVDRHGRRLGQGGGSYDRALARRRPNAFVVALLHAGEIWDDDLPAQEHDQRVHAVVTPDEVARFGR
jgi:5-formyltetrahydrofolate cyclo-ligase